MSALKKAIKQRHGGLIIHVEPVEEQVSDVAEEGDGSNDSEEYALAKEFMVDGSQGPSTGLRGRLQQETEKSESAGGVQSERLNRMKVRRRELERSNDKKALKNEVGDY